MNSPVRIRRAQTDDTYARSLILFSLISLGFAFTINKGGHINVMIGISAFEIAVGISLWEGGLIR